MDNDGKGRNGYRRGEGGRGTRSQRRIDRSIIDRVVFNLEGEIVVKSLSDFHPDRPHHKVLPNVPSGSGIERGDVERWVLNKETARKITFMVEVTKAKKKKKR